MIVESSPLFFLENGPHPWALPIVKHKAKFIMNYVNHDMYEWEGFYAYSSTQ
jgi:hypothetical protein